MNKEASRPPYSPITVVYKTMRRSHGWHDGALRKGSPPLRILAPASPFRKVDLVTGRGLRELVSIRRRRDMDRMRVLDVSDDEREARIASIAAPVPTAEDPVPTYEELAEMIRLGPPRFLYHETDARRRNRIAQEGLLLRHSETAELALEMGEPDWDSYGGVFFSTVVHDITPQVDVWVLDTEGMAWEKSDVGAAPDEIVPDMSVDPSSWAVGEMWWYLRCDVPAARLTLHELCYPQEEGVDVDVRP